METITQSPILKRGATLHVPESAGIKINEKNIKMIIDQIHKHEKSKHRPNPEILVPTMMEEYFFQSLEDSINLPFDSFEAQSYTYKGKNIMRPLSVFDEIEPLQPKLYDPGRALCVLLQNVLNNEISGSGMLIYFDSGHKGPRSRWGICQLYANRIGGNQLYIGHSDLYDQFGLGTCVESGCRIYF